MKLVFSSSAEGDLEEIGSYIAKDDPERAVTFIKELRSRCETITKSPLAAPLRPVFGEDYRVVVYGRYLIFYKAQTDHIRIERVLHGARDIPGLFENE